VAWGPLGCVPSGADGSYSKGSVVGSDMVEAISTIVVQCLERVSARRPRSRFMSSTVVRGDLFATWHSRRGGCNAPLALF